MVHNASANEFLMVLPFLMVTIFSNLVSLWFFIVFIHDWSIHKNSDGISWIRYGRWFVIHHDSMIAHHNI